MSTGTCCFKPHIFGWSVNAGTEQDVFFNAVSVKCGLVKHFRMHFLEPAAVGIMCQVSRGE